MRANFSSILLVCDKAAPACRHEGYYYEARFRCAHIVRIGHSETIMPGALFFYHYVFRKYSNFLIAVFVK